MLTRVYIDNFRSFVNFEYRPSRTQLILGPNGSGKSSLMDALFMVRQFAVVGQDANTFGLLMSQRTRWLEQRQQTFELEAGLDGGRYVYRLVMEPVELLGAIRPRVVSETVQLDGKPIFEFQSGEVHLYNDRFEHKVTYPFDWHRSALATITPRKENQKLTRFRQWFGDLLFFRLNPLGMAARAESEQPFPNVDLSNIAAWYRHLVQSYPKENAALLASLHAAIDGFSLLKLDHAGENVRVLVAEFTDANNRSVKFGFGELSDGQRCLVCLYTIMHFVVARGSTVFVDEPDNFISLREIQPWLMGMMDVIEEAKGQVFLISHHPELINQWAPAYGVQFRRDGAGPVRVEEFHRNTESFLSPSELVARGWENG